MATMMVNRALLRGGGRGGAVRAAREAIEARDVRKPTMTKSGRWW